MGNKHTSSNEIDSISSSSEQKPILARRSANRNSTLKSGRTIGVQREKVETANERIAAHQKNKRKRRLRVSLVSLGFFCLIIVATIAIYINFFHVDNYQAEPTNAEEVSYAPTIEIVDEDATIIDKEITGRMKDYIGQAEADFRDLGYHPVKVVVPTNTVREIDFYLDGYAGFIKMSIDRATAVSVEDADRMLRYLAGQGINEFSYIDVRIPRKAYWR